MYEQQVRQWLENNGWEPVMASLYDEEGVEGWRWEKPDSTYEFYSIGLWDEPAVIPDELWEMAKAGLNA